MVSYHYTQKDWNSFQQGIQKEWVITNGLGSYCGSSLIGAHNRTHQGYLIASMHPPIDRYLIFSKTNESAIYEDSSSSIFFETSQHNVEGQTYYKEGQQYLTSFTYDGNIHFQYDTSNFSFKKHLSLKKRENTSVIAYEIENKGDAFHFHVTPLFNAREHSDSSTKATLQFTSKLLENKDSAEKGSTYFLYPESIPGYAICFQSSLGNIQSRKQVFDLNMELQTEVDLETAGLDCHYCPIDLVVAVPAHSSIRFSVVCSFAPKDGASFQSIEENTAFSVLEENQNYYNKLLQQANYEDLFANQLVLASDQFLAYRSSTQMTTVLAGLPWFTDWGRDTMIAFTGLTLCTKRFAQAKEILLTFSQYIRNGIVPNMFPDNNTPPLYNTVDASLWYFYAVYQYLNYDTSDEAQIFIQDYIYPHLKEIVKAYQEGTDFSIYMDNDGLIHAGSGLDQITWMDVRVDDWVVTPRHGKPVEINALWYNALRIMEHLSTLFGENNSAYAQLADKVYTSFNNRFWDENHQCLFDVIDGDFDDHIRPNQIYAVSLPFSLLPREKELAVVEFVERELYAGTGLRSLVRNHPDYHGIYCGSLPKRDAAYHQGTSWGFLLGGFISAYLKVHEHSAESIAHAKELLIPVENHLVENGCIGSISEIFDGDAPHTPRGCYAQAWSVGETLRCYVEDILPYIN